MLPNSATFINNAVGWRNSSKRKMKEVEGVAEPPSLQANNNPFNLQTPHLFSSSPNDDPLHRHLPVPFKSFMDLLTEPDGRGRGSLEGDFQVQREQIDQIISFNCDILKRTLAGVLDRAVEERASKKLKEDSSELQAMLNQHAELEAEAARYKEDARRLRDRVRYLEEVRDSLRLDLGEAIAARRYAETEQDDAESSFVDPGRVEPVRLECMDCRRRTATVMVWPCRHVCLCTNCNAGAESCPVCRRAKSASIEICLPHD